MVKEKGETGERETKEGIKRDDNRLCSRERLKLAYL